MGSGQVCKLRQNKKNREARRKRQAKYDSNHRAENRARTKAREEYKKKRILEWELIGGRPIIPRVGATRKRPMPFIVN